MKNVLSTERREFAIDLATRAGEIMNTNFGLGVSKTWKDDNTPLTVTDLMINEMLLTEVNERFPNDGVVAEEGSSTAAMSSKWVWICDPIDGTVPFSHGVPTFAFSLGLLHDGEPVLGVINDPMSNRILVADRGGDAQLNGRTCRVSQLDDFPTLVVDLEDHFFNARTTGSLRSRLKQRGTLVETLYSAVFGASRVASGEIAAMICSKGYVWDAAAADVIVTRAGGRVTDFDGNALAWRNEALDGFVVSNGDVHDALLEEINR